MTLSEFIDYISFEEDLNKQVRVCMIEPGEDKKNITVKHGDIAEICLDE